MTHSSHSSRGVKTPSGQIVGAALAPDAELQWSRQAEPDALRQFARDYDWTREPVAVLAWVMAQSQIDLGTALVVFFNGTPERFNMLAKHEIPEKLRGQAALLDTICQRINAGFYLAWPKSGSAAAEPTKAWIEAQDKDSADGRRGRYVLDPVIIETVLEEALTLDPAEETALYAPTASILRDVFSPVIGLGVSRHDLRYLPDPEPAEEPEIEL